MLIIGLDLDHPFPLPPYFFITRLNQLIMRIHFSFSTFVFKELVTLISMRILPENTLLLDEQPKEEETCVVIHSSFLPRFVTLSHSISF